CCEIGAILGGAPKDEQCSLRDYGTNLGTAFQLVDDLLDFTSSDESMGKPTGVDLLEGKLTLPLVYLLETDPAARDSVQTVMADSGYGRISREHLLRALEESGAIARARQRAYEYAETARTCLQGLPESDYCEALRAIPSYIIERNR
ncbi:MAG: polyprenyl synthetase family protein, partial [Pyrinomonadaceae bacterium]